MISRDARSITLLVGGLEVLLVRYARRHVLARTWLLLHPFARREVPQVRLTVARRRLRYLERFLGFLLASDLEIALVKVVHHILVEWLS